MRSRTGSTDHESLIENQNRLKTEKHKLEKENSKLRTRVIFLDSEISKRDKLVEQTIDSNFNIKPKQTTTIIKSSLVNGLKRTIKEYQEKIEKQDKIIEKYQKDMKTTKINEQATMVK